MLPVSFFNSRGKRLAWEAAAVILLLALYASLTLTAVRRKTTTFDELYHITTGYSFWQTRDFQLNPQNGLPQEWAALPLTFSSPQFPSLDAPPWSKATAYEVGRQFFFKSGNDADAMLFRARAMASVSAIGLGLVVYAWSRQLFGRIGGLISLALFATCPTVLAHGPLVTADVAAAFFFTASLWAFWHLLHQVTSTAILVSGLALSGLFLSKMSAIIFLPVALVLAVLRLAVGRPLMLTCCGRVKLITTRGRQAGVLVLLAGCQALLVWGAIWTFFGFRYEAVRPDRPEGGFEYAVKWPQHLAKPGLPMQVISFARDHHLLPEAFLLSLAETVARGETRESFLNGQHSTTGNILFFPYCFMVKTATALLVLLPLAGIALVRWARSGGKEGRALGYAAVPLLVFLIVYWGFALASRLNIGHRHLLPTYPLMYVLAGGAVLWLRPAPQAAGIASMDWRPAAVIVLCLLAAAGEALSIWPHYLAYFNFLGGGPRKGYRHLVDSSLDWGQDLKELAWWLADHVPSDGAEPVYLAYFGTAAPDYYGIRATTLPGFIPRRFPDKVAPLKGGTYCISASMLQGVYLQTDLYRNRWGRIQEKGYLQVLAGKKQLDEAGNDAAAVEAVLKPFEMKRREDFRRLYEESRFARLCAVLRQREPDSQVGYSILIYHLTDEDVEHALFRFRSPPYETFSLNEG